MSPTWWIGTGNLAEANTDPSVPFTTSTLLLLLYSIAASLLLIKSLLPITSIDVVVLTTIKSTYNTNNNDNDSDDDDTDDDDDDDVSTLDGRIVNFILVGIKFVDNEDIPVLYTRV
jgi:hypothetical protein